MWAFALWGLAGSATARSVVLVEAIDRVKGRPWTVAAGGPGGWMFLLAQVLHCGIGVAVASVVGGSVRDTAVSAALVGFGLGAGAPAVVKKLSGYTLALVPGKPDASVGSERDA